MDDTVDDVDRISELPPFIIHQIMAYLSTREVVQTSILSKRWHNLQRSFPILDFDEAYRYFMATSYPIFFRRKRDRLRRSIDQFIQYVDASLLRFCELKFCMQKFKLLISLIEIQESSSILDKWIGLAIENNVKGLDFDVRTLRDAVYDLPESIFSANLLTTLRLSGCKLQQPSIAIRFHSLKSLTLNNVCISEAMVQKLTKECLLLEELSMSNCWGVKCVHISEAYKLRIISITVSSNELESIKIAVPGLQHLSLTSLTSLRRVVDIDQSANLSMLVLLGFALTDHEFRRLISKLPLLENLKVICCHSLESLVISSDRLKYLSASMCSGLKAVNINTPNLLSFDYLRNPVPISSTIKAPCPSKVDLVNKDDPDTRWYLSIKKFIGTWNQIDDLSLHVTAERISFDFDEFRSSSSSAPCEVGNLFLHINAPSSNYAALLDGVLETCHPRTLSVLKTRETHKNFVEFLHEKFANRDANCCNSYEVKCWRHFLQDFKFGGFVPTRDQKSIHFDNLTEVLPKIPDGTFQFHLDWCITAAAEKA